MKPDLVVIGAGAAGLFAAMSAAEAGAEVLLLEKTARIGTKILISGGGKCNVAHDGPLEGVIKAFCQGEAQFIRPSCYRMPNRRIMEIFQDAGLELYTRPDGRVFPVDGVAKDVVGILIERAAEMGIRICLHTSVSRVVAADGVIQGVEVKVEERALPSGEVGSRFGIKALLRKALSNTAHEGEAWDGPSLILCPRVVIACGGSSYPNSGTTGDGWKWARELGHTVVKPRAALAPIYLVEPLVEFSGVSVPHCNLVARLNLKKGATEAGAVLFTHQGVSGPAVLEISRKVGLMMESGTVTLEIDFLPDRNFDQVVDMLTGRATLGQWVQGVVPNARLSEVVLARLGFSRSLVLAELGRKKAAKVAELVKGWPVGEVKAVPIERGEVTAGGISLDEVDPQTMRSRKVEGLYLAGEVLDVAGPVGGYNLQAAFATGHVAGLSAAANRSEE